MAKKKIPTPKGNGLDSLKSQLKIDNSPIGEEEPKKIGRPVKGDTHSKEFVDMSFKVTAEFRQEFKLYAVSNGMSMKELLEIAFSYCKQMNK